MLPNQSSHAAGQSLRDAIFSATSVDNLSEEAPLPKCVYLPLSSIPGHIPTTNFNVLSLNVCSLPGHHDALHTLIASLEHHLFDVILLQEVWSVHSNYPIPGYHPIVTSTRDQNGTINKNVGGGVGIYISDKLQFEILTDLATFVPGVYESQWIKIQSGGDNSVILGNIYRPNTPPRADLKNALKLHSDILRQISSDSKLRNLKLIVASDFNVDLLTFETNQLTKDYLDLHFEMGLLPLITLSAHITRTSSKVIDHIFTSSPNHNQISGVLQVAISDHLPCFFSDPDPQLDQAPSPPPRRLINESSKKTYKKLLETIDFKFEPHNPKISFDSFFEKITAAADLAFPPIKMKKHKFKARHKPWMSSGLLVSSNNKHKLLTTKLKFPTYENISKFRAYSKLLAKLKRLAKRTYYLDSFNVAQNNIKQTWKLINDITGRSEAASKLPSTFYVNGVPVSNGKCVSNGFNEFFANVGANLSSSIKKSDLPTNNFYKYMGEESSQLFNLSTISDLQLLNCVKQLKNKTSYGSDAISNNLLKEIIPYICIHLRKLINLSFETGYVPPQITLAKVVPVFKSGERSHFTNYRPISIISSIGKLIERLFYNQMEGFLESSATLHIHQYGFRPHHSVIHPLMHLTSKVYNSINNNNHNLSILIDLKKAFDTVDHHILKSKFFHLGFRGISLLWLSNYLMRQQYSTVNGVDSDILTVLFGIPQGTVLGPLMFLLFINDLPNATELFTLLFADDTTFMLEGRDLQELFSKANLELSKASEWFRSNNLTLNATKTKYLLFSKTPQLQVPELLLDNNPVDRVSNSSKEKSVRFLGLWLDENMSFIHHISRLKSCLNLGLHRLRTSRYHSTLKIRLQIYYSLFESYLRFGITIYASAPTALLESITILQKAAIRLVANSHYLAHTDPIFKRLKVIKFIHLIDQERVKIVHKYRHGKLPPSFDYNFLTPIKDSEIPRRQDPLCYNISSPTNEFNYRSPHLLMVKTWNSLPHVIKSEAEPSNFYDLLDRRDRLSFPPECFLENCHVCKLSNSQSQ